MSGEAECTKPPEIELSGHAKLFAKVAGERVDDISRRRNAGGLLEIGMQRCRDVMQCASASEKAGEKHLMEQK